MSGLLRSPVLKEPKAKAPWNRKGSKTRVTKNGDHVRMNVMGMVCPRTGQFFAIEASHSDADTFQAFLDEGSRFVAFERPQNIIIVDNASRHKKKNPKMTCLAAYVSATIFARSESDRAYLADDESSMIQQLRLPQCRSIDR
jgi:hypothetical protein